MSGITWVTIAKNEPPSCNPYNLKPWETQGLRQFLKVPVASSYKRPRHVTSWTTLPWNSQQKPLKKARNPKGKDRLTTIHHPFLGAKMLVSGRLTTKKYAQVKLDHFPKQGWKLKKCLKPPPSNKQQTIPEKKTGCGTRKPGHLIRFVPFEVPFPGLIREFSCLFSGMICVSFTLWIALYTCALYQHSKKNTMSTKARLYNQRVTNFDPFHPPNHWGILFWKTGCLSLSHDQRI